MVKEATFLYTYCAFLLKIAPPSASIAAKTGAILAQYWLDKPFLKDKVDELELSFREPSASPDIHATHTWRGMMAQYSRLRLPGEYEFSWSGNCHYLAYHDLLLDDGEMEVTGERPVVGGDLRDKMTFVPAGQTIRGWANPSDRLNAFTVVCFDPSAMDEELESAFHAIEPRPDIYFRDDYLAALLRRLGTLMADREGPASRIHIETLGLTAALEMLRINSEKRRDETGKAVGQLSQSQRSLVRSYIDANIARDIGLDELAGLCGVSRFHFCRAFKATFGETAFQFVTMRRIDKARQMLGETRLPVAAVAKACGFSGASQFSRTFRSIAGTTPLAFRRSV